MPRDLDELELLSNASVALAELGPDEDVYQFITDALAALEPESLVTTIRYEPSSGTAFVCAIAGPEDMQTAAREVAGEPIGYTLRVDDEARRLLSEGRLLRLAGGVDQLTFRQFPPEIPRRLEARMGVRAVYGQPFSRQGDFLGAVAFLSRRPALGHSRIIEILIRLAAVAIQRRRAEAELRDSERRFRLLAEKSPDAVFRLRLKPVAELEYVNRASSTLSGYAPEELYADAGLGAPCLYSVAWVSGEPPREVPAEPTVARCARRDGTFVWAEQKLVPTRDANGDIVAVEGISRDVTKRKEAEDALREMDHRKTEFLAVLSHELRNPLGSIRNAEHVLGRVEPGSARARRAREVMSRQIAQLTRLIDDLLDVTRIARGRIELRRERLALSDILWTAVEDYRPELARRGIRLEVRDEPAGAVVCGDRVRIGQVVDNLLQNAAKFTPPRHRVSISIRADRAAGRALLRVHNTGATIPPEVRAHLFEPFVQGDRTLAREGGGLGLGLALVKSLVELHGGSVQVESTEAEGTAVTVELPLDRNPPASARGAAADSAAHRAEPGRVLLIEDNPDAAESLRDALEIAGHAVTVANGGDEGIEAARAKRPDVVLCDLGLPGMDGYQVARNIRADPALEKLPLVALSGYASPDDVARAREAGFDRHVAKPPSIESLERVMSELHAPAG